MGEPRHRRTLRGRVHLDQHPGRRRPQQHNRIEAATSEVARFAAQHPYLHLPHDLSDEAGRLVQRQLDADTKRRALPYEPQGSKVSPPPDDPETLALAQEALDDLARTLDAALYDNPVHNLGLTPSRPTLVTSFTHMFTHGSLLHLLESLWFFHLLGLVLEDTYGHLVFTLLYLATGLVAALTYVLVFRHSTASLVGASGALAGVMGA